MQIVIEIPEENYQVTLTKIMLACRGCSIIELPKGHGRLIDADEYKEHLYACETNGRPLHIMNLDERLATVDETPTIIEADMAGSEVENAE